MSRASTTVSVNGSVRRRGRDERRLLLLDEKQHIFTYDSGRVVYGSVRSTMSTIDKVSGLILGHRVSPRGSGEDGVGTEGGIKKKTVDVVGRGLYGTGN